MAGEGCEIVYTGDGQINRICDDEAKPSEISLKKTVDSISNFCERLTDVNKIKKVNSGQINPNEINVAINEILSMGVELALLVAQGSKDMLTKFEKDINLSFLKLKESQNFLAENGGDVSKLQKQIASIEKIISRQG